MSPWRRGHNAWQRRAAHIGVCARTELRTWNALRWNQNQKKKKSFLASPSHCDGQLGALVCLLFHCFNWPGAPPPPPPSMLESWKYCDRLLTFTFPSWKFKRNNHPHLSFCSEKNKKHLRQEFRRKTIGRDESKNPAPAEAKEERTMALKKRARVAGFLPRMPHMPRSH